MFPYEYSPEEVAGKAKNAGVQIVLFNMPAGNWAAGERGLTGLPGREQEFRDGVAKAVTYAKALGVPRLHAMAGIAPAGADLAACRATLIANLKYAAAELAKENITLLLEAINQRDMPGFLVSTQKDSARNLRSGRRAKHEDADGSVSHAGNGRRPGNEPQTLCADVRAHSDCRLP